MDITFTNNLGIITFQRCLVTVADHFEWGGTHARHVKTVTIQGYMNQDEVEQFFPVVTDDAVAGRSRGHLGTLTLPWTSLENVRIEEIGQDTGVWLDLQRYSVTFVDEMPDDNRYTLSFYGLELHNPRVGVLLPHGEMRDEYTQMQLQGGQLWNPNTIGAGVMRTKTAPGLIEIGLSGTLMVEDGKLPEAWRDTLVRRAGMKADTISDSVPAGWPLPFALGEAVPELAASLKYNAVIVAAARLTWNVERGDAQVNLDLICQPQRMV